MDQLLLTLLVAVATGLTMTSPVLASRRWKMLHTCEGAAEPDFNKLIRTDNLHDSFYNMAPLRKNLKTSQTVPRQFWKPQYGYLQGPRECPTWSTSVTQYGGTLCPSYSVLNYDENRFPRTLVEAKCSCQSCLSHPDAPSARSLLSCQPVLYYTSVFRRVGCTNNVYQYQQIWEPLAVACTCSASNITVVDNYAIPGNRPLPPH